MGAVVAVLLHLAVVPMATVGLGDWSRSTRSRPPTVDRALPAVDELQLGRKKSVVSSVAWIAYDDFHRLLARHSVTEQPAIQSQQDPVRQAPLELDPTPPAHLTGSLPSAAPPGAVAPPVRDWWRTGRAWADPLRLPHLPAVGDLPFAATGMARAAGPSLDVGPEAKSKVRSTGAARSDRESTAVTVIEDSVDVRPGSVLAGPGVEIRTALPRFSVVTQISTQPRNPEATITFDNTGRVIAVELTRSGGSKNVDGPILASLYKWRASGPKIDGLDGHLKLGVTLLILER